MAQIVVYDAKDRVVATVVGKMIDGVLYVPARNLSVFMGTLVRVQQDTLHVRSRS